MGVDVSNTLGSEDYDDALLEHQKRSKADKALELELRNGMDFWN